MGYLRLNTSNGDEQYALESPTANDSSTHHPPLLTRSRKRLVIALAVTLLVVSIFAFIFMGTPSQSQQPSTEPKSEPKQKQGKLVLTFCLPNQKKKK